MRSMSALALNLCGQNQGTKQGFGRQLPIAAILVLANQTDININLLNSFAELLNLAYGV